MRFIRTTRERGAGTGGTSDSDDSHGGDMRKSARIDTAATAECASGAGTGKTADGGDLRGGDMRKKARIGSSAATASVAAMDVWRREVGALSTRSFSNRLAASENLILRLDVFRKLEKHSSCVNTVSFNAAGDALVTGSDDRQVIIWDWESGNVKLSFHSEHHNNIFQAKFMPYSEDRSIVTCAADGQVRHAQILESGKVESKLLTKHQGRVHKLAIEPGSPHVFYTCGEDGVVKHLDLRRTRVATKLFTCQNMDRGYQVVTHLNAIAIDPRNPNLFAIAGGDSFARLYDIRKYNWNGSSEIGQPVDFFCPAHLRGSDHVGITGLAFSDQSELLVNYASENIYLFSKNMGMGPDLEPPLTVSSDSSGIGEDQQPASSPREIETNVAEGPSVFKGHMNLDTIKGVNFLGPKCEYVTSGSDCGRIFIWKKKGGELIRVMEADTEVVNSIEAHPHITVLASCGIESNIKIWTPRATERAILPTIIEKVFLPGQVQLLGYENEIAYLNYFSGLEGEDENDEDDDGDDLYGDDEDGDDDDPFDYSSMDDDDDDGSEEEGDEDEEEEEDEEFHDGIVGGEDVVDRSLNDDDDDDIFPDP